MAYNVLNTIENVKSYKTQANAIAAVERVLGKQNEGDHEFNVLIVNNSEGRFVPVICNIRPSAVQKMIFCGFMIVN